MPDPSPPAPHHAKQDYVLIEPTDGTKINGFDSWLCPWSDWSSVLVNAMEQVDFGQPMSVRLTAFSMTAAELEAYCDEHDIEW